MHAGERSQRAARHVAIQYLSARPENVECAEHMRPLTFMISQRRGYSFSERETRLVEILGNPQRFPKDTSQRSVSRKVEKT
jgi:hypothetical protein